MENDLSNLDLAAILDRNVTAVSPWFIASKNVRIPDAETLWKIAQAFNEGGMRPTGMHGRSFNYVYFFEGKPFTKFERALMDRISELERELATEKIRVEMLQDGSLK